MSASLPPTEELFARYGATVFRRCRQLLGTDAAAEDAVQEVFVRVLNRTDTFRGEATPLTWLFGIATLHCLQQLRNQGRQLSKLEALGLEPAQTAADPNHRLLLLPLLQSQALVTQQLIFLRHFDQLTVEEVASVLGLSRKTVTRKLQQFLAFARTQLSLPDEVLP